MESSRRWSSEKLQNIDARANPPWNGGGGRRQGVLILKHLCPICTEGSGRKSRNSHSGVMTTVREIGVGGRARERGEINNISICRFSLPIGACCFLWLWVQAASYAYWRKQLPMPIWRKQLPICFAENKMSMKPENGYMIVNNGSDPSKMGHWIIYILSSKPMNNETE